MLPGLHLSITQAADDLQISRQTLHRILAGGASVTAEMALRLERLTGIHATTWLALQEHHDLLHARATLIDDLNRIPLRATIAAPAKAGWTLKQAMPRATVSKGAVHSAAPRALP